jgi:glycyl-tRNA synthetase beta chain
LLEKEGLRSDVLNAVFDAGYEDPIAVRERARALHQFTKHEQFESFCDLAKRIRKISLGEAQSSREVLAGGGFVYPARQEVQAGLFETEAEKSLFAAYGTAREVVAGYLSQRNYTASVEALLALIGPVDEFMNRGPMVLCDDKTLRNNRVALCVSLDALLSSLVSFEKVEARRELS